MVECQVNDHGTFQYIANQKSPKNGGATIVRVRAAPGEKATMAFGQDEAIYNQNLSNSMQWDGPNVK